jgi:hypothetical protein
MKALSMVPAQFDGTTPIQIMPPKQIPFSGRTPAIEQFLNQPLP